MGSACRMRSNSGVQMLPALTKRARRASISWVGDDVSVVLLEAGVASVAEGRVLSMVEDISTSLMGRILGR